MDKVLIGIALIWIALWLLGAILRVLADFANTIRLQWDRARPSIDNVGHTIGYPMGRLAAAIYDYRLVSTGFAFALLFAGLFLISVDSAWLVRTIDTLGGKNFPLLGWAMLGGVVGISMGVGSRILELGWLGGASIARVPDIGHLRAGEDAAVGYFRIHRATGLLGVVFLLFVLAFSYSRNAEYDPKDELERKLVTIAAAGASGKIAILNAALADAVGRLESDPKSGLRILTTIQRLTVDGGRRDVDRFGTVAQRYLNAYRENTEKFVADGKLEALMRSEAFAEVDKVASLKWQGHLYEFGKGGAIKSVPKAFSFYQEAAGAGDKTAAVMQEKLAHSMVGMTDNLVRQTVYQYLEPRSQSGGPSDHYWLGEWYARSGDKEDAKKSEIWLGKAIAQDSNATIKGMAFISLSRLKDVGQASTRLLDEQAPKYTKGNDLNFKNPAYVYLEKRANAGDPGAALWMGFRFREGDGVAKDEKKAREWFFKAALQDKDIVIKDRAFAALGERKRPLISEAEPRSASNFGANRADIPRDSNLLVKEAPPNAIKEPPPSQQIPAAPAATQNRTVVVIPPNASMDYAGHSWSCNKGFVQIRNECVALQIPPNAVMDYAGHSWSCNKGFVQIRNECVALQIPPNAVMDYAGHSWSCNKGFVQIRNECVVLKIPPNASMDYPGHSWSCDKGFVQIKNECVPLVHR